MTTRTPLTPDRIVTAAIAILDRDGLEGLTMRRLAEPLGVKAMALYHHFPNREALLDAIVGAVLAEARPTSGDTVNAGGGWPAVLLAEGRALQRALASRPNVAPLVTAARVEAAGADGWRTEPAAAMADAGVPAPLAAAALDGVLALATGWLVTRPGPAAPGADPDFDAALRALVNGFAGRPSAVATKDKKGSKAKKVEKPKDKKKHKK
jgi:AcrR family transcriptional regulator